MIDEVVIDWPSGIQQTFERIAVDQRVLKPGAPPVWSGDRTQLVQPGVVGAVVVIVVLTTIAVGPVHRRQQLAALEDRLAPLYDKLSMSPGRLEMISGVRERRFWEPGFMWYGPSGIGTSQSDFTRALPA